MMSDTSPLAPDQPSLPEPLESARITNAAQPETSTTASLPTDMLLLNELITDNALRWQVHNCKLIEQTVTQDASLPFLYHYDTLSDELKRSHPLTPQLLKRFNEPMLPVTAAHLLDLPESSIPTPWQVKIIGTLVMFSEPLQLAVKLRFTNTAKALEPIYTANKEAALGLAMQSWHFFGDVFVLNRGNKPLAIASSAVQGSFADSSESVWIITRSDHYDFIPPIFSVALLSELDAHKDQLPQLADAIKLRL